MKLIELKVFNENNTTDCYHYVAGSVRAVKSHFRKKYGDGLNVSAIIRKSLMYEPVAYKPIGKKKFQTL